MELKIFQKIMHVELVSITKRARVIAQRVKLPWAMPASHMAINLRQITSLLLQLPADTPGNTAEDGA